MKKLILVLMAGFLMTGVAMAKTGVHKSCTKSILCENLTCTLPATLCCKVKKIKTADDCMENCKCSDRSTPIPADIKQGLPGGVIVNPTSPASPTILNTAATPTTVAAQK